MLAGKAEGGEELLWQVEGRWAAKGRTGSETFVVNSRTVAQDEAMMLAHQELVALAAQDAPGADTIETRLVSLTPLPRFAQAPRPE